MRGGRQDDSLEAAEKVHFERSWEGVRVPLVLLSRSKCVRALAPEGYFERC